MRTIELLRQYRDNVAAQKEAGRFPERYTPEQLSRILQDITDAESLVQCIMPYRLRRAARLYYMDTDSVPTWESVAFAVQYCSGGEALRKQVHRALSQIKGSEKK